MDYNSIKEQEYNKDAGGSMTKLGIVVRTISILMMFGGLLLFGVGISASQGMPLLGFGLTLLGAAMCILGWVGAILTNKHLFDTTGFH